jgi:hypothetical protein
MVHDADLVDEEERGCSSQEEAKDLGCSDPGAERCVRAHAARTRRSILATACPTNEAYQLTHCCSSRSRSSDLTELDLPSTMTINFPDPADKLHFELVIKPDEGLQEI